MKLCMRRESGVNGGAEVGSFETSQSVRKGDWKTVTSGA